MVVAPGCSGRSIGIGRRGPPAALSGWRKGGSHRWLTPDGLPRTTRKRLAHLSLGDVAGKAVKGTRAAALDEFGEDGIGEFEAALAQPDASPVMD